MAIIVIILIAIFLFFGWLGILFGDVDLVFPVALGLTAMTIAGICMILEEVKGVRDEVKELNEKLKLKEDEAKTIENGEGEDK